MSELGHFTGASCPHCGKPKHRASTLRPDDDDPEPSPGDAAICISCGKWAVFADDMSMRMPTEIERVELEHDPNVWEAERRWKAMNSIMKRRQ